VVKALTRLAGRGFSIINFLLLHPKFSEDKNYLIALHENGGVIILEPV